MAEYKLLLLQNYIAYKITESQIALHIEGYRANKHKQLLKDLKELEVDPSRANLYNQKFTCSNKAEAYGAAYVVEGSAMGGMIISKELENCKNLESISEHHFFNGNRENMKAWREFTSALKKEEFSPGEEDQAISKAKDTFEFFGEVFRDPDLV